MTYEVIHGACTFFIDASNIYAACIETLENEARADHIQISPFRVTPLPFGEEEEIEMSLIVGLMAIAVNPDDVTTYINESPPRST